MLLNNICMVLDILKSFLQINLYVNREGGWGSITPATFIKFLKIELNIGDPKVLQQLNKMMLKKTNKLFFLIKIESRIGCYSY